jgi:hypothetical protein
MTTEPDTDLADLLADSWLQHAGYIQAMQAKTQKALRVHSRLADQRRADYLRRLSRAVVELHNATVCFEKALAKGTAERRKRHERDNRETEYDLADIEVWYSASPMERLQAAHRAVSKTQAECTVEMQVGGGAWWYHADRRGEDRDKLAASILRPDETLRLLSS